MRYISFCLKNPLLLNIVTVAVLAFGSIIAFNSRKEAFPAVNFDIVVIRTVYPGASPYEVELGVTRLLEEQLDISGIDDVVSHSLENVSVIMIKLDPVLSEVKKNQVINNIQRNVDQITDFPREVENRPVVTEIDSEVMPVLELSLSGDIPYEELHKIADDLTDIIKKLPGAREPGLFGFYEREFRVVLDPNKLKKWHVDLNQVLKALQATSINLPGGVLKTPKNEILVRTIGERRSLSEIDQVIIRANIDGRVIRIKDVGKSEESFSEADKICMVNGKKSINLIIKKKATGDIIKLVKAVKESVEKYKSKLKNHDKLNIAYINDISVFVENRLGVLLENGLIGIILVLVCLLLFLSKGIALVAVLGMPVALLGAIITMNQLGLTINLITLFGLVMVLGMLVDDAIIVAENIWRHYEEGKSPWDAAVDGTKEVFWPVTATILTTIAAFSPLLMISGIFGKFISSLPKVVIISLVISLIEAMFILPSHTYDILKFRDKFKKKSLQNGVNLKRITNLYKKLLINVLRRRYLYLSLLLSLMVFSGYLLKNHMKIILFPNDGIDAFFVRLELDDWNGLDEAYPHYAPLEEYIKNSLDKTELKHIVSYLGIQQVDSSDPLTVRAYNIGQIGVFLQPTKDRERSAEEIVAKLREDILSLGEQHGFSKISFVFQRVGPPVGKPVALRVFGQDLDEMLDLAQKLEVMLLSLDEIKDVSNDFLSGKGELRIQVNDHQAAKALLSTAEVASYIRASLEGIVATKIQDGKDRIPIRVLYKPNYVKSTENLKDLEIINRAGYNFNIGALISMEQTDGINGIKHKNMERVVRVTANIDEKLSSSSEVNNKIKEKLQELAKSYPKLRIEQGGEYEDTNKSMESLKLAFAFSLIMIFMILATQFSSLLQPIIVMLAIPFGLIGVVFAFYLHDLPISFLSLIGGIGLSGIVVNDSIVLVDFINKTRLKGVSYITAVVSACKKRFRPVLLTTITTVTGLLPLAYGLGGEDEFLKPAAMALSYGLIFSTVLILLLVPALFVMLLDFLTAFANLRKFFRA